MTDKKTSKQRVQAVIANAVPAPKFEWPEPDMKLINGYRQDVVPFPVLALGQFWSEWIISAAASKSAPVDYIAAGLLASVSVLVGNSCFVSPWQGWCEPPVFWGCCIGNPSSGKTPGISAPLDLLRELEGRMNPDFANQVREYARQLAQSKAEKEKWQLDVKTAANKKHPAPAMPSHIEEPEKPFKKRLLIMDATVEIIAPIFSKNPKGILVFRDELSGLLNGLNQYKGGSGSDRAFYLEAWNGKSYTVDRVKWGLEGSISVPHLSIPIVGGIQPDRFVQAVLSDADDGMAARFLYFYPNPVPPKRPENIHNDKVSIDAFEKLCSLMLQINLDGSESPAVVKLEDDAADLLQAFRDEVYHEEKTASGQYLSYLGKNSGKALRLALLLELLQWAISGNSVPPVTISKQNFLAACDLIRNYFNPMAKRAFDEAALPEDIRNAMTLAKWVIRGRVTTLNTRDVLRARLKNLGKADKLDFAIGELVEAGWLIEAPDNGESVGRPRRNYLVNPKIQELL
jgi:hypothetical protein